MEDWSSFDTRPDSDSFPCLNVVSALDLRRWVIFAVDVPPFVMFMAPMPVVSCCLACNATLPRTMYVLLLSQATSPPKMTTGSDRRIIVRVSAAVGGWVGDRGCVDLVTLTLTPVFYTTLLCRTQVFAERGGCWSVGQDVVAYDVLRGATLVRPQYPICC
jgi:hypothetical protein